MNSSQRAVFQIIIAPNNGQIGEGGTMVVELIEEHNERYLQLKNLDDPKWMVPIMDEAQWDQIKTAVNYAIKLCK